MDRTHENKIGVSFGKLFSNFSDSFWRQRLESFGYTIVYHVDLISNDGIMLADVAGRKFGYCSNTTGFFCIAFKKETIEIIEKIKTEPPQPTLTAETKPEPEDNTFRVEIPKIGAKADIVIGVSPYDKNEYKLKTITDNRLRKGEQK